MALSLDLQQIKSKPYGVVKSLQIVLGLLLILTVCVISKPMKGTDFIALVAGSSILASVVRLFLMVIHYERKSSPMHWILSDLTVCSLGSALYLICLLIAGIGISQTHHPAYGVIIFFGVIAFGLYAYNAWMEHREYKVLHHDQASPPQMEMPVAVVTLEAPVDNTEKF